MCAIQHSMEKCIFALLKMCTFMNKTILTLLFSAIMLFALPVSGSATQSIEIIDNDFQQVTISVQESVLHVTGANGQVLEIFNVAGVKVMSFRVEGFDKRFELNLPKGCYIVKVGKTVRKISIR